MLGVALLVIDAHVVSHGALTVSGLIALGFGMVMLFHNAPAPYHTSVPIVLAFTLVLGLVWVFALTKAVQVRRRPPSVGPARVVGAEAVVRVSGPGLRRGRALACAPRRRQAISCRARTYASLQWKVSSSS